MNVKGERGAWLNVPVTRALLAGDQHTSLSGSINWDCRRGTRFQARIPVLAPPGPWEWLAVEMAGNTQRPAAPTISYFSPHGYVRRLCVNGEHQSVRETHEHAIDESGVLVRPPAYLSPVPNAPDVAPGTWEQIFRQFVDECRIVVPSEFDWQAPWEGA